MGSALIYQLRRHVASFSSCLILALKYNLSGEFSWAYNNLGGPAPLLLLFVLNLIIIIEPAHEKKGLVELEVELEISMDFSRHTRTYLLLFWRISKVNEQVDDLEDDANDVHTDHGRIIEKNTILQPKDTTEKKKKEKNNQRRRHQIFHGGGGEAQRWPVTPPPPRNAICRILPIYHAHIPT